MKRIIWAAVVVGVCAWMPVWAGPNANGVVGVWLTDGRDCKIEVYKESDKVNGKIVWLKEPTYEPGHAEAGKPKRDSKNPDPARQNDTLVGLNLLKGFSFDGTDKWTGGTVYDPENGKTYKCVLSLGDENTLNVRGYLGIQAFGRTSMWTRAPKEEPAKPGKEG
jgi:uncharacterized protein (DUF2147 family)